MALTAYDGLAPTIIGGISTNSGSPGSPLTNLTIALAAPWKVNDYCVVMVETDAASADPNDVHSVTGTVVNFTKLFNATGMSVWIGRNTTGADILGGFTVSVTWAVACVQTLQAFIVTNSSGYAFASNSAVNVAINTDFTVTIANIGTTLTSKVTSLQLGLILARKNSASATPVIAMQPTAKPASLANLQLTVGLGQAGGGVTKGRGAFIAGTIGEYAAIGATSTHITVRDSATGNTDWLGCIISFQPTTVTLDDNTFQLDTGPLLNSPDPTLPIYDIDTVTGLSDMNVTNTSEAIDGTDGSYVSARYLIGKTVILEGTIYGTVPFTEGVIDTLKTVSKPKKYSVPFYYKPTGKSPRVLNVFPIQLVDDIDRNRALGQAPFQLQVISEDAFSSSLAIISTTLADAATTQQFTVTIEGSAESYPIIYFTVAAADVGGTFKFISRTWIADKNPLAVVGWSSSPLVPPTTLGGNITIIPTTAGMYKLDLKNRILQLMSSTGLIDHSSDISIRGWWTLLPSKSNSLEIQYSTASVAGATVIAPDAWS